LIFNVYAVKNCNRVTKEGNLQREREGMSWLNNSGKLNKTR
jgi:hypothetical protein